MRTVGVLGDIHSEDRRLVSALAHLRALSVDKVLAVGDIADGPGDFVHTCQLLRSAGVDAVRGNHDRWLLSGTMRDLRGAVATEELQLADRRFLDSLPVTRQYHTPAGPMLLCHGLGLDDMAGVKPEDRGYDIHYNSNLQALITDGRYQFVVNGHTHRRMVRRFGSLTIINAGTLHGEYEPGFAFIDFASGQVAFYDLATDSDGEITVGEAERHRL